MKVMVLKQITDLGVNRSPLDLMEMPIPVPKERELLVKVSVCGVCHTELDEIEGRTPPSLMPIVPGHQVIGRVVQTGGGVSRFAPGDRIGIAWIHSACGACRFCQAGMENLCDDFKATGRDAHGGYAEYTVVNEQFAYAIPEVFTDSEAAPLLCAGAIGHRSLRLTNMEDGYNLGLSGFGASAHLVLKMARHVFPQAKIFVFSRTAGERVFAKELGAVWAGGTEEPAPEKLHAIIDTTPAWTPVVASMHNLEKGGRLVINAIRKEDRDKEALFKLDYAHDLWMEKEIKSVANITRKDVEDFLKLAAEIPLRPHVEEYALADANTALIELKERNIRGAKVLRVP